jgi:hypothetical protein
MRRAGFERWTRRAGWDSENTPTTFDLRKTESVLAFPSRGVRSDTESELRRNVSKRKEIFSLDSP